MGLVLLGHAGHPPSGLTVGALVALVVLLALVLVGASYVQGAEGAAPSAPRPGPAWLPGAVREAPAPLAAGRLVLAVAGAGLVHLAAAVVHQSVDAVHAVSFALLGLAQLGLARRLHRLPDPGALRLALAGSLWVSLLWALTRTTGVALVSGRTPVGALDAVAVALQLAAAWLCVRGSLRTASGVPVRP